MHDLIASLVGSGIALLFFLTFYSVISSMKIKDKVVMMVRKYLPDYRVIFVGNVSSTLFDKYIINNTSFVKEVVESDPILGYTDRKKKVIVLSNQVIYKHSWKRDVLHEIAHGLDNSNGDPHGKNFDRLFEELITAENA